MTALCWSQEAQGCCRLGMDQTLSSSPQVQHTVITEYKGQRSDAEAKLDFEFVAFSPLSLYILPSEEK